MIRKKNKKPKRSERKIPLICPICGTKYNYNSKICQECNEKPRTKALTVDAFLDFDMIGLDRTLQCDINTTVVSQRDEFSFLVSNYSVDERKHNEF